MAADVKGSALVDRGHHPDVVPEAALPQLAANPDRQLLKQIRAHLSVHRNKRTSGGRRGGARFEIRRGRPWLGKTVSIGSRPHDRIRITLRSVRPAVEQDLLDRDHVFRNAALRGLLLAIPAPHAPEPPGHHAQNEERTRRNHPENLHAQRRVPETLEPQQRIPKVGTVVVLSSKSRHPRVVSIGLQLVYLVQAPSNLRSAPEPPADAMVYLVQR